MSDRATMPWRDYGALVAGIAVAGLGLGTALPLSALTLDRWGFGNHVVGALALTSAGILLVAPFVAGWVRRAGARRLLLGAVVVSVLSIGVLDASRDLAFRNGKIDQMLARQEQASADRVKQIPNAAVDVFEPGELSMLHIINT